MELTDVTGLPCTSANFAGLSADILRRGKSLRSGHMATAWWKPLQLIFASYPVFIIIRD
jgi:hypothetical protein